MQTVGTNQWTGGVYLLVNKQCVAISEHALCLFASAGRRVVVHKQEGHIESRIAYYLMNIHITPRSIYLTRVSISRGAVTECRVCFVGFVYRCASTIPLATCIRKKTMKNWTEVKKWTA